MNMRTENPVTERPKGTSPADRRLTLALKMAQYGFFIFPLLPGSKNPYLGESWSSMMTQDPAVIRDWFAKRENMNYGVCGGLHGAVIDLDQPTALKPNKPDGFAAFGQIEGEQDLDDWISDGGLAVDTPSGGRHIYVVTNCATSNAHSFPSGIDVRGSVGYVVGPGSELIEGLCNPKDTPGDYDLAHDAKPKLAPEWIKVRLEAPRKKDEDQSAVGDLDRDHVIQTAREALQKADPAIEGSGGNLTTFKLACVLRERGISFTKAINLMMEPGGWNDRCQPSWSLTELRAHRGPISNAYHYGQNRPGSQAPDLLLGLAEEDGTLADVDAIVAPSMPTVDSSAAPSPKPFDPTFPAKPPEPFKLMTLAESLLARGRRKMFIPGWLIASGFTVLLAKRGTGKTTVMIDQAQRLARDMDWQGWQAKEDLWVVYAAPEDPEGVNDLALAWCKKHNIDPSNDSARIRFTHEPFNLLDDQSCEQFVTDVRAMLKRTGVPEEAPVVVYLDTWQKATSGESQNDDEAMQKAVRNMDYIARELGGCAVASFHPPKAKNADETVMGSSVIENGSMGIWILKNDKPEPDSEKTLTVDRLKARGEGHYRQYRFEEIPLGTIDPDFNIPQTGSVAVVVGGTNDPGEPARVAALKRVERAQRKADIAELIGDQLKEIIAAYNSAAGEDGLDVRKEQNMTEMVKALATMEKPKWADAWGQRSIRDLVEGLIKPGPTGGHRYGSESRHVGNGLMRKTTAGGGTKFEFCEPEHVHETILVMEGAGPEGLADDIEVPASGSAVADLKADAERARQAHGAIIREALQATGDGVGTARTIPLKEAATLASLEALEGRKEGEKVSARLLRLFVHTMEPVAFPDGVRLVVEQSNNGPMFKLESAEARPGDL